jgi:O-antigen/teichoic acid export membrane protein
MRKYLRQLVSESAVYGLAGTAQRFVAVLLVPVYTRMFAPEDYGRVGVISALLAAVGIAVVLGLDNSAHRWFWDSEDPDERKRTIASWLWCQLPASVAAAGAMTLAAVPLARMLLDDAGAAPLLRVAAWTIPAATLPAVLANWLRMQRRAWATAAYALGFLVATVAASIVLVVWLRRGVQGVFEAQILVSAAGSAVAVALMLDWLHPARVDAARLREMLRFALPLIPAAVAFWAVGMVDRLWVQRYAGTADVGLYQVGAMVAAGVAVGTTAFQQAWGPFSLSIHRQEDARGFYATALLAYLWAASLAAAAVGLFAPEVLHVFATPAYAGAASVVPLLAFGFVLLGSTYVGAVGPLIARQTSPVGAAVMVAAAVNVVVNLVLTPRLGKEGPALANLVSYGVMSGYLFWRAQRVYPIPYRFGRAAGLMGFAGVATAAGVAWAPEPSLSGAAVKVALLLLWLPALVVFRIAAPRQVLDVLRRTRSRTGDDPRREMPAPRTDARAAPEADACPCEARGCGSSEPV